MRCGAILAAAASIALSGCGGWSDVATGDPDAPPQPPSEVAISDVVEQTGTPLPTEATDVTALRIDDNPLTYRVTFDSSAESTHAWCLDREDVFTATYSGLTDDKQALWGISAAPEGSLTCAMSSPDGIWEISTLISSDESDPMRVGMVQVN